MFLCLFLCGALTVSLTGLLLGGSLAEVERQSLQQEDGASDGSGPPGTWLGRGNPQVDVRAAGDFVALSPEGPQPLDSKATWIRVPANDPSTRARTVERWRATPVRGPPSSMFDC